MKAVTADKLPRSHSNRLPGLCASYLAAAARRRDAEREERAAREEILALLGHRRLARVSGYVLRVMAVPESSGRTITKDMVGQQIGARKGYDKLEVLAVSEEVAA